MYSSGRFDPEVLSIFLGMDQSSSWVLLITTRYLMFKGYSWVNY